MQRMKGAFNCDWRLEWSNPEWIFLYKYPVQVNRHFKGLFRLDRPCLDSGPIEKIVGCSP